MVDDFHVCANLTGWWASYCILIDFDSIILYFIATIQVPAIAVITWHVPWAAMFLIYNFLPCLFCEFVRKISNFFFNTEIYIPLVLLIQNIYSLRGPYLTVLEPFPDKQTERAIYIGDWSALRYFYCYQDLTGRAGKFQFTINSGRNH